MKSEKGITLTSLVLYIMLVLIVLGILSVITASFQNNLKEVNKEGTKNSEVDSFNMYFLQEVKKQGNKISTISGNEISFTTGNQYSFRENEIYLNDNIKISENIENCVFSNSLENGKTIITVTIKAKNAEERSIEYVLSNEGYSSSYENESDYINNEHLPNGYKQIEYLESTGVQYVDTGVKASNETGIDINFSVIEYKEANANQYVCFIFGGEDAWMNCSFDYQAGVYGLVYNKTKVGTEYNTQTLNDKNNEKHNLRIIKQQYYFDNQFQYDLSKIDNTIWESNSNIVLFGINRNNNIQRMDSSRIYGCKMYVGNRLVRDFQPVIDSNNIVGLYDKVENKCYYNQGTGDFIAGPEI